MTLPVYTHYEGTWTIFEPGSDRYVVVSEEEYTAAYDKINALYRKD